MKIGRLFFAFSQEVGQRFFLKASYLTLNSPTVFFKPAIDIRYNKLNRFSPVMSLANEGGNNS